MHLNQKKHANAQISTFGWKEIEKLLIEKRFKIVISNKIIISNKIVMLRKVISNTQGFNSCFFDIIKDFCIDKAYEKNHPVMHAYNNNRKNIMLEYLPKISEFG